MSGLRWRPELYAVPPPAITVRAPGKVNLFLRVGPKDGDGYHELANVFMAVGVFEEVTATQAAPGAGITLTIDGPTATGVPADSTNLAWRAAKLLAKHTRHAPDVALQVTKTVPVAGGLAGGSADAAATLLACDGLWETRCSRTELMQLAAILGSDVPFCLLGHTAIGTGRGHLLSPIITAGEFHWALAVAGQGLSAADVYQTFDELHAISESFTTCPDNPFDATADPALLKALRQGDAEALGKLLANDLQAAAVSLYPNLAQTIEVARVSGALGVLVSGSGPTVAALASSERHATALASIWVAEGVADQVLTAVGPVPGARIV